MQTIRKQIISLLEKEEMSAKEISKAVSIREKEVYEHLEHVRRSLKNRKKKLVVNPFRCGLCDYVFKDRKRFARPGRCPQCKQGRIMAATYRII
jgi:predicted Zn-ribbon and HTH transcriptional regulator